jgi:hypothetical protein
MATDYAEKEREFVAALAGDTGRDLSAWMDAISSAGLAHRNDIIDWLRQNGFTFANASWLERIHHNGGRLVYGDDMAVPERAPARPVKVMTPLSRTVAQSSFEAAFAETPIDQVPVVSTASPVLPTATAAEPAHTPEIDAAAAAVLLSAKGLRPLAMLALQEIARAIPDTRLEAQGPLLLMLAPKPYLALLPGAKTLRFYGDFERDGDSRAVRAEASMKTTSKAPPPFSSVLVLVDARLVDDEFAALVKRAHARVQG